MHAIATKPRLNILIYVLDDNESTLDLIRQCLDHEHFSGYRLFTDANEFLENLNDDVHLAILDYWLDGDMNGLQICKLLLEKNPQCFTIVLSAQHSMRVVIDFMNTSADRYVMKQEGDWMRQLMDFVKEGIKIVDKDLDWYYDLISRKQKQPDGPTD